MRRAELLTSILLLFWWSGIAHAQQAYYTPMKEGLAAARAGRYEEAHRAFVAGLKAARHDWQKARAFRELAILAQRKGEMISARGYAQRAARLKPDDPDIRALVAQLERGPSQDRGAGLASRRQASAPLPPGLTVAPRFTIPLMGTFGPCHVQVPEAFFSDPSIFRHPIRRSDIVKIEVFDRDCPKNGGLPKDAPPNATASRDLISTRFYLSPQYAARVDPKYMSLMVDLSGPYARGAYNGPVGIWIGRELKRGGGHVLMQSDDDVRKVFKAPIRRSIGSDTRRQAYAVNGRFLVDRAAYQQALNDKSGVSALFDVRLSFISKDNKDLDTHQLTRLVRVAGSTADVSVRYTISPRAGATDRLKATSYKLTLALEVEFEIANAVRGVGRSISRRVLSKDVDVIVRRSGGYAAGGSASLGQITSASSGQVLVFQVDTNITSARPLAYVKKVEPQ